MSLALRVLACLAMTLADKLSTKPGDGDEMNRSFGTASLAVV